MDVEFTPFPKIASLDRSIVPLSNGGNAICSEEDYGWISKYSWFHLVDRNIIYAARVTEPNRFIRMHTEVFGDLGPDHINGDGLDNRRDNLRYATNAQNQMNRGKFAPSYSVFKGVSWNKRDKKWIARIKANGHRLHLGYFINELDAARAYDAAAAEHFGDFARLNLS